MAAVLVGLHGSHVCRRLSDRHLLDAAAQWRIILQCHRANRADSNFNSLQFHRRAVQLFQRHTHRWHAHHHKHGAADLPSDDALRAGHRHVHELFHQFNGRDLRF